MKNNDFNKIFLIINTSLILIMIFFIVTQFLSGGLTGLYSKDLSTMNNKETCILESSKGVIELDHDTCCKSLFTCNTYNIDNFNVLCKNNEYTYKLSKKLFNDCRK